LWIPTVLTAASCSNTKFLSDGQSLLVKHRVEYVEPDTISDVRPITSGLLRAASQQPNEKMLGIARVRLWLYNRTRNATKGLGKSLHEKGGEPPAIFDSTAAHESTVSMTDFLFDKGYFHAHVTYSVKVDSVGQRSRKKARVTYHVTRRDLSTIDSVIYDIEDARMNRLKNEGIEKSPLKAGKPYDVDFMRRERNRITTVMQDWGYRDFGSQYIFFEADTLGEKTSVTIHVKILPPDGDTAHRVFYIGTVFINPDYKEGVASFDTLVWKGVYILHNGLKYRPHALVNPVHLRTGELYSRAKQLRTYRRLSELDAFQFINIRFVNDRDTLSRHRVCDVIIELVPMKARTFNVEATANSSSDQFKGIGTELKIVFKNRNLLKITDQFALNLSGGVEGGLDTLSRVSVNTIDVNGDASITFPSKPLTKIRVGGRATYLKRLGLYDFQSVTFSATFNHLESAYNRFTGGFELLFSKLLNNTAAFDSILAERPLLARSFENVNIFGPNLTFTYNSQARPDRIKPHILFLRLSGDVGLPVPFVEVRFSSFGKMDGEVKRLWFIQEHAAFVTRLTAGVAVPFGNEVVVPYIKQFVIGGSNSIRAWRVRSLGPGAYTFDSTDNAIFFEDQAGDIRIEANAEYRFDIVSWLKAAFFVDAGNIWLIRPRAELPNGEFRTSTFLQQFAIGSGIGLRFDFDFLILRVDLGAKVRYPTGEWPGIHFAQGTWWRRQTNINLGIGYPF
jgi:outer membrane protein assembly factor BamA